LPIKVINQINGNLLANTTTNSKASKYRDFNFKQSQEAVATQRTYNRKFGSRNDFGIPVLRLGKFSKFAYNAPIAITDDGRNGLF